LEILVDATAYRTSLTATIADIIVSLRERRSIAARTVFDTDALRPVNPTATSQLHARQSFSTTGGTHWISPGTLLPLTLDYRLWQAQRPILIKVTAIGALEMTCILDEASKTLDIELVSALKVHILNSFQQGGREVRVPEVLDLRSMRITATSITYRLSGSSVDRDLIIEAIYDATHAALILQEAPYRIKWGQVSLKERVKLAFRIGVINDESGCAGDEEDEKKWILWHKVEGDVNICEVASAPTCVSTHPKDNAFKSLGCYSSEGEANAAERAHERCKGNEMVDPFTLASRIQATRDVG